jgi:serine/threonine protein kinase
MGAGPETAPIRIGSEIGGKYRLKSVLGEGSFATIYLGERNEDSRNVVVKLFSHDDSSRLVSYELEASVSGRLVHPNLVQCLDAGSSGGHSYLVFEWIEGCDLKRVLSSGALAIADAVNAARAIAGALQYAHERGIIHRDLKPSNVLVPGWPAEANFSAVKLVDFGIAGELTGKEQLTRAGDVFGTPIYMSPEQILGEPQTAATDVYGFGLLLYEMLVGHPLHSARDSFALFQAILHEEAPGGNWGLPPHLADLIHACVQRNPADRPSFKAILQILASSDAPGEFTRIFQRPNAAPGLPPRPGAPQFPGAESTLSGPGEFTRLLQLPNSAPGSVKSPSASPLRSKKLVIILAGACVLAVAVTIPFTMLRSTRPEHPPGIINSAPGPVQQENPQQKNPETGLPLVLAGAAIAIAGLAAGYSIRGLLSRSSSRLKSQAFELALDAKNRVDLTATIAMQVTGLVSRLRDLDERILAGTVALMLDEYRQATEAKDRQAALMNVVSLSEKLGQRLSPWYVRYKDVIGSGVAIVGALSGLLTAFSGLHGGHKP